MNKTNHSSARVKLLVGLLLLTAGFVMPVSADTGIDLHWLWDDRCASCHGHSSEFANKFLSVSADAQLQGRHHVDDLHLFLQNHYLTGQLVDDVSAMLVAQLSRSKRFNKECAICHKNAASLVREKLQFQNSVLEIKKTVKSVKTFMKKHRHLTDEDIEVYTALLYRVAKEVNL
jgi:hypothetical protein